MIGLSLHAKQRDDEGGDEGRKAEDEKAERGGVCGYSGVQTGKSKGIGWGDLIGG